MNPRLMILLVAFGSTALGSAATWFGYRMARADSPDSTAASDDSGAPRPGARAGRGPRGQGPGRAGRGGGSGPGRGWAAIAHGLDLTPEQRQAWVATMRQVRTTCALAQPQGGLALDLLGAVAAEPAADAATLHARLDEQVEGQRKAAHCALTEVQGFMATLTPAQRAALGTHLSQVEARRQAWEQGWSP